MSKKKNDSFDEIIEKLYWFIKTKFRFDDIQTAATIVSILFLPISFYLGIMNPYSIFKNLFFATLAIDFLAVVYSIIKRRYFKDIREKEKKSAQKILIDHISVVDKLSGVDFEKFVEEYYKLHGYKTRSTQYTHDNGADIIAEKDNVALCIEAKRRNKKINRHVVLSVHYAMEHVYRADKAVIFTNTELTDQARAAAKDKNVEYIDRYDIERFLRKNSTVMINSEHQS